MSVCCYVLAALSRQLTKSLIRIGQLTVYVPQTGTGRWASRRRAPARLVPFDPAGQPDAIPAVQAGRDARMRGRGEGTSRTCGVRCGEQQRRGEQHGGAVTSDDPSAAGRRHSSFAPAGLAPDSCELGRRVSAKNVEEGRGDRLSL